ncbi:MAG: D-alanine--D-alanine ligase, partial [Muribaculaceae bacterium]|nr:D-alanine--D-alanine ligase [Muribaculaceae bacterium]
MKTNIGVFFGGRSTEHEISVISANQAMHAIDAERYNITPIYITKQGHLYTGDALMDIANYRDIPGLLARCNEVYMRPVYGDYNLYSTKKSLFSKEPKIESTLDVVIPVLHGANGEDGSFQGILQASGIPFAGCDVLSSANGMDKITMKMILRASGIPVVDFVWFTDRQWFSKRDQIIEQIEKELGYPVIIKPSN